MLNYVIILLIVMGTIFTLFGVYSILVTVKLLVNPKFWRVAAIVYLFAMIVVYIIMALYALELLDSWGWLVFLIPITTITFGVFNLFNLNKR